MKFSIFELQLHNIGNKIHFILRFEIKNNFKIRFMAETKILISCNVCHVEFKML